MRRPCTVRASPRAACVKHCRCSIGDRRGLRRLRQGSSRADPGAGPGARARRHAWPRRAPAARRAVARHGARDHPRAPDGAPVAPPRAVAPRPSTTSTSPESSRACARCRPMARPRPPTARRRSTGRKSAAAWRLARSASDDPWTGPAHSTHPRRCTPCGSPSRSCATAWNSDGRRRIVGAARAATRLRRFQDLLGEWHDWQMLSSHASRVQGATPVDHEHLADFTTLAARVEDRCRELHARIHERASDTDRACRGDRAEGEPSQRDVTPTNDDPARSGVVSGAPRRGRRAWRRVARRHRPPAHAGRRGKVSQVRGRAWRPSAWRSTSSSRARWCAAGRPRICWRTDCLASRACRSSTRWRQAAGTPR